MDGETGGGGLEQELRHGNRRKNLDAREKVSMQKAVRDVTNGRAMVFPIKARGKYEVWAFPGWA